MIDVLVLPVSALLLGWHRILQAVLDPGGGAGWTAAVVLLVVTLRLALLFPALRQLQATRRLRAIGPQLAALRARRLDREELARQTLALQRAHGAGPGATLLPVLVQLPVVLGLFLLLTQLARSTAAVGALDPSQVASFAAAELLGAPLVATDGPMLLGLLAAAGLVLHLTARLALRRQPPEAGVATTSRRYRPPCAEPSGRPRYATGVRRSGGRLCPDASRHDARSASGSGSPVSLRRDAEGATGWRGGRGWLRFWPCDCVLRGRRSICHWS